MLHFITEHSQYYTILQQYSGDRIVATHLNSTKKTFHSPTPETFIGARARAPALFRPRTNFLSVYGTFWEGGKKWFNN